MVSPNIYPSKDYPFAQKESELNRQGEKKKKEYKVPLSAIFFVNFRQFGPVLDCFASVISRNRLEARSFIQGGVHSMVDFS